MHLHNGYIGNYFVQPLYIVSVLVSVGLCGYLWNRSRAGQIRVMLFVRNYNSNVAFDVVTLHRATCQVESSVAQKLFLYKVFYWNKKKNVFCFLFDIICGQL